MSMLHHRYLQRVMDGGDPLPLELLPSSVTSTAASPEPPPTTALPPHVKSYTERRPMTGYTSIPGTDPIDVAALEAGAEQQVCGKQQSFMN